MENQLSTGANAENANAKAPQPSAPITGPASAAPLNAPSGTASASQQKASGAMGKTVLSVARTVLVSFIIAGVIVSAGYAGLCAYAANGKTIWPGISVLGVELSGLTVDEAAARLDEFIEDATVELYLYYIGDEGTNVSAYRNPEPDYAFPLSDLGFHPDTRAIAQEAYDLNVTNPEFFSLGWRYLTGDGETEYAPVFQLDPDEIAAHAQEVSEALSYAPTDTVYGREEDILTITMPRNGRDVPAEPIVERLEQLLKKSPDFALDIPYSAVPHAVVTAEEIHEAIYEPVKNAWFDPNAWEVAPGEYGVDFNVGDLQAVMDESAPGATIEWTVTRGKPTITYDQLKAVLFRDVLGEASTKVSGTAARVNNVRLAARAINNAVVNSGEVFSYNGRVGRRTTAKGYQAAPAYVQGLTVDEIGGGVCQPSSTLYLACLRSNMQITERSPHRYVPSYIPAGMDATVSWGGPDYKFTNNTPYPVKIVTSYSDGTLTVKLIGTKTNSNTVKITNEFISSTNWKTEYKIDRSLPKGTQRVEVTPYTGKTYRTYRNIYDGNGKLISSKLEATSVYKVRNQVIAHNP